jgi:hypothetical protein
MAMFRQSSSLAIQIGLPFASMDAERKEFLNNRLLEAISKQLELDDLKSLLFGFGGEFLVAPWRPDNDIPALLQRGFLTFGPVRMHVMNRSSCHQNVAAVWQKREHGIVAIATGYALSEDGLWRQHSWGILRDAILETTEKRCKYFGIVLQGKSADNFAAANPPAE